MEAKMKAMILPQINGTESWQSNEANHGSMNVTAIAADEDQLILWIAKIPRIFMSTLRTLLLDPFTRIIVSKSLGSVLEYLQNISRHV